MEPKSNLSLDEPVHVVPYNAAWPSHFEAEREKLTRSLGLPLDNIVHIGSTAVPGLIAKPIVDIMIGVTVFSPAPDLTDALVSLEYQAFGEAGVPRRLYFAHRGNQSFNIAVVEYGEATGSTISPYATICDVALTAL